MSNQFIGDTLFSVYNALKKQIEIECSSMGIGYGQIKILMVLFANVEATLKQSDLALKLGIDKSNTSRNIVRLKQKDYIEVVLLNKRDKGIRLTDKGKLLKPEVLKTLNRISNRMTEGLVERDLKLTNHVLVHMEGNLK